MTKWHIGVDETGNFINYFAPQKGSKNFLGAVICNCSEQVLQNAFDQKFQELNQRSPHNRHDCLSAFHANALSHHAFDSALGLVQNHVKQFVRTSGMPMIVANNQGWWIDALRRLLEECLSQKQIQDGDEVIFLVDPRKFDVVGIHQDTENKVVISSKSYHESLRKGLLEFLHGYAKARNLNLDLHFSSDTHSPFVTLADLAVYAQRHSKLSSLIPNRISSCDLRNLAPSAIELLNSKDYGLAFLQCLENVFTHQFEASLMTKILEGLRKKNDEYLLMLDGLTDWFERQFGQRAQDSTIMDKLCVLYDPIAMELIQNEDFLISQSPHLTLRLWKSLLSLDSHLGKTQSQALGYLERLLDLHGHQVPRLSQYWQMRTEVLSAKAQIDFNQYRFEDVQEQCQNLWDTQEKIVQLLDPLGKHLDETSAELAGTLGQALAFGAHYDLAIECFEYSLKHTLRTNMSKSFLFYCRLAKALDQNPESLQQAIHAFEALTQLDFARLANKPNLLFDPAKANYWNYASYARLAALCMARDYPLLLPDPALWRSENQDGYPYFYLPKWFGISHILRGERAIGIEYLREADQMIYAQKGFTLRSLSVATARCLTKVGDMDARKYEQRINELAEANADFARWIQQKGLLQVPTENETLLECGMCLPFYYS